MKAKKHIGSKRKPPTRMERVEMMQTGRKPKGWKTPPPKNAK